MVCDDRWCSGYGKHEYDPDQCPLHTWPPARATLYLPVSNERGRLHLAAKQDAAVYPCRYCGMKLPVSAEVFDENPFCASCLNERMRRTTDPLEQTFDAEWHRHGKRAGPIRNQRMLEEGQPDLIVAFPGGHGTADMVRRARQAGIEVHVFDETAASVAMRPRAATGERVVAKDAKPVRPRTVEESER